LPDVCYSTIETTGEPILLKRDETGYFPFTLSSMYRKWSRKFADDKNARLEVTKAQEAAMVAGSMFGWDTPDAHPKNYDSAGQLLPPDKRAVPNKQCPIAHSEPERRHNER
jgi:hypothetical protein